MDRCDCELQQHSLSLLSCSSQDRSLVMCCRQRLLKTQVLFYSVSNISFNSRNCLAHKNIHLTIECTVCLRKASALAYS